MDFHSKIVDVTPELAERFLENQRPNRSVSWPTVQQYARAMAGGEWHLSNQGIGFDSKGKLADGQHRLHAVIEHGRPVRMQLTWGLTEEAISSLDRQRPRTAGDVFSMRGIRNGSGLAARITALDLLLRNTTSIVKYSQAELDGMHMQHYNGLTWVQSVFPSVSGLGASSVAAAFAFAYEAMPTKIAEIAEQFKSGANLSKGDPMLVLRNHIFSIKGAKKSSNAERKSLSLKTLNAIYNKIHGKPMERCNENPVGFEFFKTLHARQP